MPPKKGKRTPQGDWGWVGTEVKAPEQITAHHRLRAAGLHEGTPCRPNFPPDVLERILEEGKLISSGIKQLPKASDQDAKQKKAGNCSEKACAGWHRCYNHLGIQDVVDWRPEDLIEERLGEPAERRKGHAGLRNLGALCYANAFLQVWYHNVAFRNGIYAAVASSTRQTPLYHLATIFASLGYSERAVVDPTNLVKSLGLNTGAQQDAAEFSKLFTTLIGDELAKHPDPAVKNLLSTLFEGKTVNSIECIACKYVSRRRDAFLELDINLKDGKTIEQCLEMLINEEILDGDNKYHCPRCGSLQKAKRRSFPEILPNVLNLALMRFTYSTNGRTKSKVTVKYANELNAGGMIYDLKAVVTHQGTSAHHGHFICDVYDESEEEWLQCSDELVSPVRNRKKRPRVILDAPEVSASKDAYMLVYQKRAVSVKAAQPPPAILRAVEAGNIALDREIGDRYRKEEIVRDDWGFIRQAQLDVARCIEGETHVVPKAQLHDWFAHSDFNQLFKPWDYSSLLCPHGGLDPARSDKGILISADAFDRLASYASFPELEVCAMCVELSFDERNQQHSHAEQVQTFDNLNIMGQHPLSKSWLDTWRKGDLKRLGKDPTYSLFCHHDARWDGKEKTQLASPEAVTLLQSIFGDFEVFVDDTPLCFECTETLAGDEAAKEVYDALRKDERRLKALLDPERIFGEHYYSFPPGFIEKWEKWQKRWGDRPTLSHGTCEHGGLDWDPAMSPIRYTTAKGWQEFCKLYGYQEPASVVFEAGPLNGRKNPVTDVRPPVCEDCLNKRCLNFETTTVRVILQTDSSAVDTGPRRGLRSRGKQFEMEISKATTARDIKLMILEKTHLSPIYQSLRYKGEELSSEDTIASISFLAGDEIVCEPLEDRDMDDVILPNEGFGGTALVGGLSCPQCTFVNKGTAEACDMCDYGFGLMTA